MVKKPADFSNVKSGLVESARRRRDARRISGTRSSPATASPRSPSVSTATPTAGRRSSRPNRDQLEDPDLIHPGQKLKIPAAQKSI